MTGTKGHIHLIAIGGSAMHNLAIALKEMGYRISGSDDEIYEPSRTRLLEHGLFPEKLGWYPERISKMTQSVILGMHARKDNPELEKALRLNLPVYSFPDFVFEASKKAERIVIAGSHGKTTITSMILHVLKSINKDFDYLVGAGIAGFENMVKLSHAPVIILEGDEYLSSALDRTPKFIRYNHNIGLISGIAWDHINAFPTRENYIEQFEKFIDNTPEDGYLIYFKEDPVLNSLISRKKKKFQVIPYSTPSYAIKDDIYYLNTSSGAMPFKLFGKHNMQNVSGSIEVLKLLGLEERDIIHSLSSFTGAINRLEKIFENQDYVIYKDFAHSPSKLKSTAAAVRELYSGRRIVACFELHTYSSLNQNFLSEYKDSFRDGDVRIVFVNDHTFEIKKMPQLDNRDIIHGFNDPELNIIRNLPELEKAMLENIIPNTVFLFMSSGNFGGLDYNKFIKSVSRHQAE